MDNREKKLQDQVLNYLKRMGGYWVKVHVTAYSKKGTPDVIGCYKGKFYAFELKREDGGVVSKIQQHTLEQINHNGGTGMIIKNIEQLKKVFDGNS